MDRVELRTARWALMVFLAGGAWMITTLAYFAVSVTTYQWDVTHALRGGPDSSPLSTAFAIFMVGVISLLCLLAVVALLALSSTRLVADADGIVLTSLPFQRKDGRRRYAWSQIKVVFTRETRRGTVPKLIVFDNDRYLRVGDLWLGKPHLLQPLIARYAPEAVVKDWTDPEYFAYLRRRR